MAVRVGAQRDAVVDAEGSAAMTAPTGKKVPRQILRDWGWMRHGADFWMNPKVTAGRPDEVKVWREAWGGNPDLEPFIENLREAANGLVDAEIELISGGFEEFPDVYVTGYRGITDYDRERLAEVAAKVDERDRAEYEALRERFEGTPPIGRLGATDD